MKALIVCTIVLLASMFLGSTGKRVPSDNDENVELSDMVARSFLNKYNKHYGNREVKGDDCVPCKFNMVPCCKPNLCIKKSLRPDECLELLPR